MFKVVKTSCDIFIANFLKKKEKENLKIIVLPRKQIAIPFQFLVYLHFKNLLLKERKWLQHRFVWIRLLRYCFQRNTAALKTKETINLNIFRLPFSFVIGSVIALVLVCRISIENHSNRKSALWFHGVITSVIFFK